VATYGYIPADVEYIHYYDSGSTRNTEKRRERSKVAARCRRGKESEIFADLSACLPLPETLRSTLDKASIARIAVTCLKLREMMDIGISLLFY
jgi:hypoxia-inducible factor 1 alpha